MRWWHRRRFNRRYGLMAAVWPNQSICAVIDGERFEAMWLKAYGKR